MKERESWGIARLNSLETARRSLDLASAEAAQRRRLFYRAQTVIHSSARALGLLASDLETDTAQEVYDGLDQARLDRSTEAARMWTGVVSGEVPCELNGRSASFYTLALADPMFLLCGLGAVATTCRFFGSRQRNRCAWPCVPGISLAETLIRRTCARWDGDGGTRSFGVLRSRSAGPLMMRVAIQPSRQSPTEHERTWVAASTGSDSRLRECRASGVSINALGEGGMPPLVRAAHLGHAQAVRALLAVGADRRVPDRHGLDALAAASRAGHLETVRVLLSDKRIEWRRDRKGRTAVMHAAGEGHTDVVAALASSSTRGAVDDTGSCAVLYAARGGHDTALFELLSSGHPPSCSRDAMGWSALCWAASQGRMAALNTLVAHGASLLANGPQPLSLAARFGRVHCMHALIRAGAVVDALGPGGWTALLAATYHRQRKASLALLNAGASPSASVAGDGRTALMCAAKTGMVEVVAVLLSAGAHPDEEDAMGHTALSWAAQGGRASCVKELLSKGAEVDSVGGQLRQTPLLIAAEVGSAACIAPLLDAGACAATRNADGEVALGLAVRFGHEATVIALLHGGAAVDARALSLAVRAARVSTVASLATHCSPAVLEAAAPTLGGRTAVCLASERGEVSVLSALLAAGASRETRCDVGWTPLMHAAAADSGDAVRILLAAGADAGALTDDGQCALSLATGTNANSAIAVLREFA